MWDSTAAHVAPLTTNGRPQSTRHEIFATAQLAHASRAGRECWTGSIFQWRRAMAPAKHPIPQGYYTVTPQLTFDNAAQAIDWYKNALGAKEISRAPGPDGKIMHADIQIGNSHIMLNDPIGNKGPKALGGSPAALWLYVEDCDALFNRAV